MKSIAIAAALALGTSIAMAQSGGASGGGVGSAGVGNVGDVDASKYWSDHSKDGYMTGERAMAYKSKDGKAADMKAMDKDNDGQVSRTEWIEYQTKAGKTAR